MSQPSIFIYFIFCEFLDHMEWRGKRSKGSETKSHFTFLYYAVLTVSKSRFAINESIINRSPNRLRENMPRACVSKDRK